MDPDYDSRSEVVVIVVSESAQGAEVRLFSCNSNIPGMADTG
jgi:hypothetical protein